MSNPNAKFTWIPVYTEIAKALLKKYTNNQQGLLDLLKNIHNSGIPFFMGEPDHLADLPINKIDPFSFFMLFNLLNKSKRIGFIEAIRNDLGLTEKSPDDFEGANIGQAWGINSISKNLNNVDASVINHLWELASKTIESGIISDEIITLFKERIDGFSYGYLTTSLYLMRPDCFIPQSKPVDRYLEGEGIRSLPSDFSEVQYCDYLQAIEKKFPDKQFNELVHTALDNDEFIRHSGEEAPNNTTSNVSDENAQRLVLVNRHERDPKLRKICINNYGYRCAVCGFLFEEFYGDLGNNYIHVHHIKGLAESGGEQGQTAADLCPVCPNCHAMLHKQTPAMDVEVLKSLLIDKRKIKGAK